MKSIKILLLVIVPAILGVSMISILEKPDWDDETPVFEVLAELGEDKPEHFVTMTDEKVKRGEDLVKLGKATGPNGEKGKYISKFYTCTSCHNLSREDPNLATVDQDARLKYAMENKIPYLQGSTFWGIVNRETWYNDDYVLKYGDLVRKAENSLKASTELCAVVCSQGRSLKDWEMESILAYMWSLQMKMGDLDISKEDTEEWKENKSEENVALIKSKYLQKSPATFAHLPESKSEGYPFDGRPEMGKGIFELGCQHCHRPDGESDVVFENNKQTLGWLKKHITDDSDKSIYQIIRKGTYAEYGHKEYMPHYTLEKMSHQQVEDLRAFIEEGA
ncbi:MAG: cytochrome c [Cyclobacteriaceae bacterium]